MKGLPQQHHQPQHRPTTLLAAAMWPQHRHTPFGRIQSTRTALSPLSATAVANANSLSCTQLLRQLSTTHAIFSCNCLMTFYEESSKRHPLALKLRRIRIQRPTHQHKHQQHWPYIAYIFALCCQKCFLAKHASLNAESSCICS